jgi:hypothetical protein
MQDNRFSESRLFREAESAAVYPHRRFMPPVKKMYPVGGINRRTRALFGVRAPYRLSPVPPDKPPSFAATLARSHGGKLQCFFSARVHNRSDVPDLTQEVFLRMLRILDRDAIRSVEAHLFTVALHVAQQHALRETAVPPSVEINELLAQLHAATDADPALQALAQLSCPGGAHPRQFRRAHR